MLNWIRNLDIRKVSVALGIAAAVAHGVVSGQVPLDHLFPDTWHPYIIAWLGVYLYVFPLIIGAHSYTAASWTDPATAQAKQGGPTIRSAAVIAAFIIGSLALFGVSSARAADLPNKAASLPAPLADLVNQPCTQTSCQGFYAGLSLYGEGGNAAVLQNGLSGSVFAGGGMIGGNVGWENWSNGWFIAGQFDALLESAPGSNTTGFAPGGFVGLFHVKLGGNAGNLLGTAVPAGSQGPIAIPQKLLSSLVSPYFDFCTAIRQGTTQWCGGAGAQFNIGGRWTADLIYDYGAPTTKVNALQIVGLQADYHF